MKKLFLSTLLMCWVLCAALTGCTAPSAKESVEKDAVLSIVATNFPLYDFARELVGPFGEVHLLLPAGAESHTFEPTPQDILRIGESDLFLYIGGYSETWVDRILQSANTPPQKALRLMDCISPLEEETQEGMQAEMEDAHEHKDSRGHVGTPAYDEHIWTSPQNAIGMAEAIGEALSVIDPANAAAYQSNLSAYIARLQILHEEFLAIVEAAPLNTILFGDRFPFLYFARAYGLSYYAAFPGCAEHLEPSASTVAFLIDKTRAENIPVVFHIEASSHAMAQTIARAAGAKVALLHSCHTVTKAELESGASYISLMQQNAQALKEALRCP